MVNNAMDLQYFTTDFALMLLPLLFISVLLRMFTVTDASILIGYNVKTLFHLLQLCGEERP